MIVRGESTIIDYHAPFDQGPVPERRNNSIPGINVPYFRDNFICGINTLKYSSKCALKSLTRRGLARLVSATRPNSNRSAILFSQIYPWNSDLLPPRKV